LLQERVKDLAGIALEKGIDKASDLLPEDMALNARQKELIGKILEGTIKAK
jgi:hypothetical protein